MTWLKENRFLAALVAATIALGAAAVFLMTQSMAEYHEAVDAYSIAVQKLHALQDRSPFPNAQNLEKTARWWNNTKPNWIPCAPRSRKCRRRRRPRSNRKNFRMTFAAL